MGINIRGGWWTRLGRSKSTAIFAVNRSTAAAKVDSHVAMCVRGRREKGVAIGGWGGGVRDCNASCRIVSKRRFQLSGTI